MEQSSESSVQTTPAGYYCDINGFISPIYDPAHDCLELDWGDHCCINPIQIGPLKNEEMQKRLLVASVRKSGRNQQGVKGEKEANIRGLFECVCLSV